MTDEEAVGLSPRTRALVDEQITRLLDGVSSLLASTPSWLASALTVKALFTTEPSEQVAIWRYCRRLAYQRGLRASAILRGQSLTLRFERPSADPYSSSRQTPGA